MGSSTLPTTTSSLVSAANLTLNGLAPSTTYYYNVNAVNSDGTAKGYTYKFTTTS